MVSPFDLAASHPTMGGPSKKKLPSFSSVPDIVVSNTDMISFSSSSGYHLKHPGPPSPSGVNEVITVTFSTPSNIDAFQAFDNMDVENPGGGGGTSWIEKGGNIFVAPSSLSFADGLRLDNFYRPPKLEGEPRRFSGLSMDGSTAATSMASSLRRMSWQSIETFDQSYSGMEFFVSSMQLREERKKKVYKCLASATMFMALCYAVASFFASEDVDEATIDSIPMEEVRAVLPKFLDPFHGSIDSGVP